MGRIVNTTIQDNKVIVHTKDGTIEIWPTMANRGCRSVRLSSDKYTINGVDYRLSANATLRNGTWEITYLGGDRTPWRTPKDFGFTRSAREWLRVAIPTLLSIEMTPETNVLFEDADAEHRRINATIIQNQLNEHTVAATKLRVELRKCQRGDEYTPYPIDEGRA